MMLTPNGQTANKIEKVMLLALWANALKEEKELQDPVTTKKLIAAGMGKPTYPINAQTITSYLSYWQKLKDLRQQERLNPEEMQESTAIDYGDPRGDKIPRTMMAESMSAWYESEIGPEHILFTVGGIGALRTLFETFNTHYEEIPGYRIITPFPHYSAYANNPLHRLHPVDVMKEPGYKLTAEALEKAIEEAYLLAETDQGWPKAILICNPSNPLGTIIDEAELQKIANVLRCYPELHLIFDEAYTEMAYKEMPSFLKIAPDLKHRTIIMRSATKALSAAGERMAVLLVFDSILMNELLNKNISYFIHAPRSAQIAYAQTMKHFNAEEKAKLADFYKKKVDYVIHRLQTMGAAMPDSQYEVEATFYALADFSDLFDLELPREAQRALQKTGRVSTGEELSYYLLFKDAVMIAPLSYFGLAKDCGFMRITCSATEDELKDLMDRLELRLSIARTNKKLALMEQIQQKLPELQKKDPFIFTALNKKIMHYTQGADNCLTLKTKNKVLKKLYFIMMSHLEIQDEIISASTFSEQMA
ncbi:pyridoxal phosphate-dependent aminotransferase [Legionella fallonii]|uniref:Aminotransferase n=1 Tax=Legionella fallonii LLAP-10 TaxID=1212491 RepID=A0A098G134_9GAMM|nr:pyridoxal phosphate-dependent aminotransferase [Legionella fallonii]CEG56167.1 putative Cysteine-S-conjugate beta-lyase [Legionella fallonii LLAP-10]